MTEALFDPYDPVFRADPYPTYARLRAEAPVSQSPAGSWAVARYDDCSLVLRDPRFGAAGSPEAQETRAAAAETPLGLLAQSMLFMDPPDHTRVRDVVMKAFTPRAVDSLSSRVEAIVGELLDAVAARGEADLIDDLAYPLPVAVICEMLAIPGADHHRFREASRDLAGVVDIVPDFETAVRGSEAASYLIEYFRDLIPSRKSEPGDDVLSALVVAEHEGHTLSTDELLATCVQLLFAGHETTQNLIGNGMLALLRDRAQFELLRRDGVGRTAVEELLRYDGPAQIAGRWTREPVRLHDVSIPAGQPVIALLGSANRDPAAFASPDSLDVSRSPNPHVTFGAGVHFCLGAPLARMEGRIAIDALVRRFPKMELATDEVQWRKTYVLRGLESLAVTV